ncbi:MAG: matrixin family metalloprotease [Candidatus Latescibacterota bacterium]
MKRAIWTTAIAGVLLWSHAAHAYRIYVYTLGGTSYWGGEPRNEVQPGCHNDLDWTEGKTTENPGAVGQCVGGAYPPAFWDASAIGFYFGAHADDTTKVAQTPAIESALDAWDYAGSNIEVRYYGANTKTYDPDDGYNVICAGRWSDLGVDVGITIHRVATSPSEDVGEIRETDVLLNDGFWWTIGTYEIGLGDTVHYVGGQWVAIKKDIQSVVTHELGHALGLGHTGDDASSSCVTMHTGTQCEASPCSTDTKNLGLRSLQDDDKDGLKEIYGPTGDGFYVRSELGSDKRVAPPVPRYARLLTACPNPFNPEVTITFVLDQPADVSLSVHDVVGQHLADLVSGVRYGPGEHAVTWRPQGDVVASGVYLVRLTAPDCDLACKVVLAR